jgi:hypothetical protein
MKNATDMTSSMIIGVETFLKPCAYGAPQAASGLDQRLDPYACGFRVINAALRRPNRENLLTSHASYKPAHDDRVDQIDRNPL